jgi:hypothetical protein
MSAHGEHDGDAVSPARDELIARVLRAAGPRRELPPELAARWHSIFARELHAAARRRRLIRLAAVASVALATLVGVALVRAPSGGPTALAQVVHLSGASVTSGGPVVRVGDGLYSGSHVRTGPDGFVGFAYRDADVRLGNDSTLALHLEHLELRRGKVYIDTGAGEHRRTSPIVLETQWGTLTHVGTQFLVQSSDAGLSSAVREGTIVLRTGAARRELNAPRGAAAIIEVDARGRLSTSFEPVGGERWGWISSATPGFAIAGHSALAALEWAARETGRELLFADAQARTYARGVVLGSNADARARSLEDVRVIVTRLTDLTVKTEAEASIRVALERNSEAD